ncbi:MAG: AAA family ATPase [Candidatus Saccharibacteria bacterium]
MTTPILYLFVGYPGAGKTSISKIIHQLTGAEHLWADHVRSEMFGRPAHSTVESQQLYDHLNHEAAQLLTAGKSVIYDTNFNFKSDREALRKVANEHNANTTLIWVTTPLNIACQRAVQQPADQSTRVLGSMTQKEFDAIVAKLEVPDNDENPIKIDGTKFDVESITYQLSL